MKGGTLHYHVISYDADQDDTLGNVSFDNSTDSIEKYLGLARMLYRGRIVDDLASVESAMYEMTDDAGGTIACGVNHSGLMLWWVVCPGCVNPMMN